MQKVDRHVFRSGGEYRVIIASGLASCLHLLRSDPRASGQRRIGGARDPSYFKRAGKRRTGLIRKFRRC